MTLESAMHALKSLKLFVESKRDEFDKCKEAAKGISKEMDAANLYAAEDELVKVYKDDLEPSLGNELVQFVSLINLYKTDYKKDLSKELFYNQILENQNFPNIEITLRMYSVLMV
ncbi:unnamed protein product [Brassicogethes aeneus]|uniref:Uncharacterized protein n=1 Tax=Brassicogethes aeneus TaxID=1431903 RepID=A0A9P0B903_BRAAE|nr:unnamed protein product [Brassicogethes aeneus]